MQKTVNKYNLIVKCLYCKYSVNLLNLMSPVLKSVLRPIKNIDKPFLCCCVLTYPEVALRKGCACS